jgi:hypothetical protein
MQIILMHSLYPSEIGDFVVTSCSAGDTGFYAHHDYLRCADGGTHIPVGECRFTFLAKYPASQRRCQTIRMRKTAMSKKPGGNGGQAGRNAGAIDTA